MLPKRRKIRHRDIRGRTAEYRTTVKIAGKEYKFHKEYFIGRNALREEKRLGKLGFLTHVFDTKASGFLVRSYVIYKRERGLSKFYP